MSVLLICKTHFDVDIFDQVEMKADTLLPRPKDGVEISDHIEA